MLIRFGTSGWPAISVDAFTFAGVRTLTETSGTHFGSNLGKPVVAGHDTRFSGQRFAADEAFRDRATGAHLARIRISYGLGGAP